MIHIARNTGTFQYPADCMIIGAMNPCPCGYYPNPQKCNCKEYEIHRYLGKISGPLLDRMDICTEAPKVEITDLTRQMENESSEVIRGRVMEARMRQQKRYEGTKIRFNADLNPNEIREFCPLGRKEQKLMEEVFVQMNLSARAYHRTIKVARTIADLEGSEQIKEMHLLEAITYRMADSRYWG